MKINYFDTPSILPVKIVVTECYPNDGLAVKVDGRYEYIKYSNGDRIWLKVVDGEYVVTMVCTHEEKILNNFNKSPFGERILGENFTFEDTLGNIIVWSSSTLPESDLNTNYSIKHPFEAPGPEGGGGR